jgi:hypothetical protein
LPVEPAHHSRHALVDLTRPAGRIGFAPAHDAATNPAQFANLTLGGIPECGKLKSVRVFLEEVSDPTAALQAPLDLASPRRSPA